LRRECGPALPFVQPILHAAYALANTLTSEATALHYPVMPVVVKTPACPAVVCRPSQGVQGQWQESVSTGGVRALFRGEDGGLLGFALTGMETVKEQMTLAAQVLPAD
jgi:rubredoxin---NAD+ reductase